MSEESNLADILMLELIPQICEVLSFITLVWRPGADNTAVSKCFGVLFLFISLLLLSSRRQLQSRSMSKAHRKHGVVGWI